MKKVGHPTGELLERRTNVLSSSYRLFYETPIHLVRGSGVELFDVDGNRFLDAYNNVPIVGHCHPRVVQAQCEQAKILNTHTRYLSEAVVGYAEQLLATMDGYLNQVMLTCTGSEAIDLALRITRSLGKPRGVIITENAYHGVTALAAAVSPSLGAGCTQEPWVRRIAVPRDVPPEDMRANFAAQVQRAITDLQATEHGFAALLMDMAFASDGIFLEPAGFPASACLLAQEAGGLVIADEVQAGFGRTGATLWGHQFHGLTPDLVVMGKSMANGLPVGAVVGRRSLMDRFAKQGRYFNTYGGNPVCMSAAAAVLDVIKAENLVQHAGSVGAYLHSEMRNLVAPYGQRVNVRGVGLFAGIQFRDKAGELDPEMSLTMLNGYRNANILVGQCGPMNSSIKIRPPLPFSTSHVDELLAATEILLEQHIR